MTVQVCTVAVKQLPEISCGKQAQLFFDELGSCMSIGHACIVLDFSQVRQIDRSAIYLLLSCLENALKHDGDVKLASTPSGARAILEFTGVVRLFECFETNAEAVSSFRRLSVNAASSVYVPFRSHRAPENAA